MSIPIVTVIGKSGSGKTTLLEKLIAELVRRGYQVGTVKHHSHSGFEIDYPAKDSWRHARAGSRHVVISAPEKIASYRYLEKELSLDEVVEGINDVHIILVEGYKGAGKPAVEVVRAANKLQLVGDPKYRIAVAADVPLDVDVPQFDINDYQGIANLIEERFLKQG